MGEAGVCGMTGRNWDFVCYGGREDCDEEGEEWVLRGSKALCLCLQWRLQGILIQMKSYPLSAREDSSGL